MRLFIALEPSPDFLSALSALQDRLREAGVTARYLAPSNLHLTLAFIGEWPEAMTELLPPVTSPFPITLSNVGIFPEARVLWAGMEASEKLDLLAGQVRSILSEAGIPFDRRRFVPHITLARKPSVPNHVRLSDLNVPPASMTVRDLCLYRSSPGENGRQYTVIGRASENENHADPALL